MEKYIYTSFFLILLRKSEITEKHREDQNIHIPTTQIPHLLLHCPFSSSIFWRSEISFIVEIFLKHHPYSIPFFPHSLI